MFVNINSFTNYLLFVMRAHNCPLHVHMFLKVIDIKFKFHEAFLFGAFHSLMGSPYGVTNFFFFRRQRWPSRRPNTMKETLLWPNSLGKTYRSWLGCWHTFLISMSESRHFSQYYYYGYFLPTGMPHRVLHSNRLSSFLFLLVDEWESQVIARALWPYTGQMPCDLTFRAGK